MKKSKFAQSIVALVFLIAFNAIFFLVADFPLPVSVWIAYGVVHFSYLAILATPLFVKRDKNYGESFGSLALISSAHFAFQFIAGIIIMLIAPEGYKAVTIFYIVTIAIYLIVFFSVLSVNGRLEAATARRTAEIAYIRNYASRIKMMIGRYADGKLDAKLEKVYDELYTSPARSIPQVADVESDIARKIGELESAARAGQVEEAEQMIRDLLYLIEDRNRILKNHY